MIDHSSVAVSDYQKSKELYTKLLAPLGYTLKMDLADYHAAGFVSRGLDRSDFWIGQNEGQKAGGVHVAFTAQNKEEIAAFHQAGLDAGGKDNGAPGYRKDYSPGYYAAFIKDFDDNNIEAVWRDPNPPAA
ncbi:MAG TPA: VOC family protein [Candidatus Paceibacterota bacterium]|jgi:predicted lactoylglutathione lyase|nr:VOC family protein [Candidatus Paceibacterota bacterium]